MQPVESQNRSVKMKYGYARVSTDDQTLDGQIDALEAAGCDEIFSDHGVSGASTDRPELSRLLETATDGDQIVVWRLDRLGRSMQHVVTIVTELGDRGVQFASLTENIDTTTASGELIFHIFASLAHFERRLISERTKQGLEATKRRGTVLGRPRALNKERSEHVRALISEGRTISEAASILKVSRSTVFRALRSKPQTNELVH